jgi:DNA repair protein RecO (recombination protein O)
MKFSDSGFILSVKNHSESSAIVKIFSQNHGVYSAFVKSINSKKNKPIFQIANLVNFEYRSRIEENLGQIYGCDLINSFAGKIIFKSLALNAVNSLFAILNHAISERDCYLKLFESVSFFLAKITSEDFSDFLLIEEYIKLEIDILNELGYGVDLSRCVATNSKENLSFVSPKSAKAVSYEAGKNYQNKLLILPNFLINQSDDYEADLNSDSIEQNQKKVANIEDLKNGMQLSGFFLEKFIFNEENNYKKNYLFYRNQMKKKIQSFES